MSDIGLFELGDQSILVADVNARVALASVLPPSGDMVVARLDGAMMTEARDVFEQVSGALRFPAYFGWNWNALSDCLLDLSWWPTDRYLIVVDHADEILAGYPEERKRLFAVLSRVAREWANPLGKIGGQGVLFKVLLLAADDVVERIQAEIAW